MAGYTARRLLSAVFVIFGVTLATSLLMHLEPGDPARSVLGIRASPSAVAALRRQWGLDSSLPAQFGPVPEPALPGQPRAVLHLHHVSTASLIGSRVGETAALVAVAAVFASYQLSHGHAGRAARTAWLTTWSGVCPLSALPYLRFGSASCLSRYSPYTCTCCLSGARGAGLPGISSRSCSPAFTAALAIAPILVRSLRVGMIEVLDSEFVAVARAKGLGEVRVLFGHVARNALLPTVTLLGLNIAFLIGSTVVVEQVLTSTASGRSC